MGYKRRRKTYDLAFEDPELEGLEVRMHGLSVGEMLRVQGIDEPSDEDEQWLFELLATRLVSWNLEEEDGTPVPGTLEAIHALDFEFAMKISDAWIDAIGGVSAPLDESSPGGAPSPEASIPMAPLSGSPGPLPEQSGSWGSAVPSTFSRASS